VHAKAEGGKENARRDEAVRLREAGLTYAEIGRRFGISTQRVGQILKPKSRQKPKPKQKPKRSMPVAMLSIRDVSSLLGVHANTVRRWSDRGLIRAYRISRRGDRRFRRRDVARFLAELNLERSKANKSGRQIRRL
jgi:excisionase family DNA binding protein